MAASSSKQSINFEIAIPSYKRSRDCLAADYLLKSKIWVHEFEAKDYSEIYGRDRIRIIPDDLQRQGMGVIRNFILDNSKAEAVLMVDDDVQNIGYYENGQRHIMGEGEVMGLIRNGFRMCSEAGTVLWGINLLQDRMAYREYSPFSLTSVVPGPFMGIIKDKSIRFDDDIGLKEDYDYSLQVLRKYRKIFRMNKYHYLADHITKKGGCASYRTSAAERRHAERFEKKWGSKIVKIESKRMGKRISINPLVSVPIRGI